MEGRALPVPDHLPEAVCDRPCASGPRQGCPCTRLTADDSALQTSSCRTGLSCSYHISSLMVSASADFAHQPQPTYLLFYTITLAAGQLLYCLELSAPQISAQAALVVTATRGSRQTCCGSCWTGSAEQQMLWLPRRWCTCPCQARPMPPGCGAWHGSGQLPSPSTPQKTWTAKTEGFAG